MIPTTATSSSPPAALGVSLNMNSPAASKSNTAAAAAAAANSNNKANNHTALLGIASLILEGRALSEDEYEVVNRTRIIDISPVGLGTGGVTTAAAASGLVGVAGRQSPSTSRAALAATNYPSVFSSADLSSYIRRKAATTSNSMEPSSFSSYAIIDGYSSSSGESASSSVESNHSRWSQKLSQLRQESPTAHALQMDQRVTVAESLQSRSEAEYVGLNFNSPDLEDRRVHFECVRRRMALNRMNLYNSPSAVGGSSSSSGHSASVLVGGTDNFMHSLQSLASNSINSGCPTPRYNYRMTPSTPRFPTPSHLQQHHHHHHHQQANLSAGSTSSSGSGIQSPRANTTWYPTISPLGHDTDSPPSSSSLSSFNKDYFMRKSLATPPPPAPPTASAATISCNNPTNVLLHIREHLQMSASSTPTSSRIPQQQQKQQQQQQQQPQAKHKTQQNSPQQGPHCDQFLRKMGLAKGDTSETEEHHCDMMYVNIACTRWRAYCIKMENILTRGEPICIEVYLGPVGHKILLEQWIITMKDKQPPPTMTLPSLCSAIRSQLYFSQISAWCDLIKKSDKTIYETGRLIYSTPQTMQTTAAGDLATTTAPPPATIATVTTSSSSSSLLSSASASSSSSASTSAACTAAGTSAGAGGGVVGGGGMANINCKRPRLNIFYRIKQYDSTACFNSKPNIHNFPNVNISENYCVSICLKSLPRISGGIPKVGTSTTPPPTMHPLQNISPTPKQSMAAAAATNTNTTTKTSNVAKSSLQHQAGKAKPTLNCDNNLMNESKHQQTNTAASNGKSPMQAAAAAANASPKQTFAASSYKENTHKYAAANDDDVDDGDFEFGSEVPPTHREAVERFVSIKDSAIAGDSSSNSSSISTNANYANLSHRDKQLLKYRKRMLKRDKKLHIVKNPDSPKNDAAAAAAVSQASLYDMEQGDDEDDEDDEADEDEQQQQHEQSDKNEFNNHSNAIKNSNGTNDIVIVKHSSSSSSSHECVKMISTGTQTNNSITSSSITANTVAVNNTNSNNSNNTTIARNGTTATNNCCTTCGNAKILICLKCQPLAGNANITDDMDAAEDALLSAASSSSSLSSTDIIKIPRNDAELLLQAIQRTPKSNKKHKKTKESNKTSKPPTSAAAAGDVPSQNNNSRHMAALSNDEAGNSGSPRSVNGAGLGCQVCKRQKTQHNFAANKQQQLLIATIVGEEMVSGNNYVNEHIAAIIDIGCDAAVAVNDNNATGDDDDAAAADDNEDDSDGGKMLISSSDCVDNMVVVVATPSKTTTTATSSPSMTSATLSSLSSASKQCDSLNIDNDTMEEEYYESSTKLTPNIERCSLSAASSKEYYAQMRKQKNDGQEQQQQQQHYVLRLCSTPPLVDCSNSAEKDCSSNGSMRIMEQQFKTPTNEQQQQFALKINTDIQQQPAQPHKQTPKPNLLRIACNFNHDHHQQQQQISGICQAHICSADCCSSTTNTPLNRHHLQHHHHQHHHQQHHNPLLMRRSLPKVNLTPIFCNPTTMMAMSSPIPIQQNGNSNGGISPSTSSGCKSADINITEASPTFSFESPSSPAAYLPPPTLIVQKSNSAPTLPNSPSLSPRFVKATAIYKRRSRHLSDRSDRSSLCSDEQFSDEDIDSGMYSPFATSPIKLKLQTAAAFGRKPLLGNLEESLLQRRLVPKIEVMGFKLLLGASGGFCPTQLTIPAAAYFYELKGETLSTPYLCEIRLPRKGYTVPRFGTVQATLLNPMGTVVRMFVIPYDMRDMPALHQTFIRQRILADTGGSSTNVLNNNIELVTTGNANGEVNGIINASNTKAYDAANSSGDCVGNATTTGSIMQQQQQQQRSPQINNESNLGHFISSENMKSLRYSIHLRFQTSRSGRLMLHTDIRLLISRRTDCDTAAAHAKGVLEAPNELITDTVMPNNPKYSARQEQSSSKI